MSLVEHAKSELARINEDPELTENLVATVAKFAEFGHSGGSAPIAIHYLTKLLSFEPLSPLTSDPAEWIDRTEISGTPMWQSTRDPKAFSTNGGKTWYRLGEDTKPEPSAAYIEIVEKNRTTDDTLGGSLIVPNEVRINGIPLLCPDGEQVKVHAMTFNDGHGEDVAQVTLTLFARRVVIAAEGDL